MEIRGSASSALRDLLDGPPLTAEPLGAGRFGAYLRVHPAGETPGPERVLALLTGDAVRLPCAVVLPRPIAPPAAGGCVVGDGGVHWTGRHGALTVTVARYWHPARVRPSTVPEAALRAAIGVNTGLDIGVNEALVSALGPNSPAAVAALLGRGPGLTPAGDDVLAGFVLAARAFGIAIGEVRAAIATHAPAATTALSAQLLRHALAGECVAEVLPALERAELAPLLAVGHTSGAALARGLLRAAEIRDESARAA